MYFCAKKKQRESPIIWTFMITFVPKTLRGLGIKELNPWARSTENNLRACVLLCGVFDEKVRQKRAKFDKKVIPVCIYINTYR